MSTEDLYRVVFEQAPDGIVVVELDGRIADANPAALEMFGWDHDDLVGQPVEVLVPGDARGGHAQYHTTFASDARSPRPMGIGMELRGLRRDGDEFPVEISLSPIGDGRTLATVRDVTLRRRLRNFSAGALRAVEDVRTEIARELHDQTAQELAALMIQIRLLERDATELDRSDRIEAIRRQLLASADGVRRIARGLRPPELEDAGIRAALEAHARGLLEDRGLAVSLEVAPVEDSLTPDSLLILYRIVQEALNNVARHAGTDRAYVQVWMEGDDVHALIRDEGCGFPPRPWSGGRDRLGLMGMHERASMVGGHLEVHSVPGDGTRVQLRIPVEFDRELQRV